MITLKHRGRFVDRAVVCGMVVIGTLIFWIGPEFWKWDITKSQMLIWALACPIILFGGWGFDHTALGDARNVQL